MKIQYEHNASDSKWARKPYESLTYLHRSSGLDLLLQAYYAGFGNMDFFLERHYGVKGSASFVRRYNGAAFANGVIFLLILLIPVIGLVLAPFMATIAATKVCYDRLLDEEEDYGYA